MVIILVITNRIKVADNTPYSSNLIGLKQAFFIVDISIYLYLD